MVPELDVEDVRVSRSRTEVVGKARKQLMYIEFEVVLRNTSNEATYYAVSSAHSFQYDARSRTLTIGLHGTTQASTFTPHYFRAPETSRLLPGESKGLRISVPRVLKDIHFSESAFSLVPLDISSFEHVRCRVAYNTGPFSAEPTLTGRELERRFIEWGHLAEKTFDVKAPAER